MGDVEFNTQYENYSMNCKTKCCERDLICLRFTSLNPLKLVYVGYVFATPNNERTNLRHRRILLASTDCVIHSMRKRCVTGV